MKGSAATALGFAAVSCFALLIAHSAPGQPSNPPVRIVAWGDNSFGQCSVPANLTNAISVSAGAFHSLALRNDGIVIAWGNNDHGQCNVPSSLSNVVSISAGYWHSLALQSDGTVVAWGDDSYGQCDLPTGVTNIVAISAGNAWSLELLGNGSVIGCGQHGVTPPSNLTNATAISAPALGGPFAALCNDGTVLEWGIDFSGQAPPHPGLTNAVAVSAGGAFRIALKCDRTLLGWGEDTGSGQLNIPIGLSNLTAIAAGGGHTLGLKNDGSVVAWGWNNIGQCNVPEDLRFVTAISAGGWFSLALVDPSRIFLSLATTQTVAIGSSVTLSASALSPSTLYFQWYFNATNAIAGATNRLLFLCNLGSSQSGTYSVAITNAAGGNQNQTIVLNVLPGLAIDMVPAIRLFGDVGSAYQLQFINAVGPTNTWQALATLTITNNPQVYPDYSAIGQPKRFYRLVKSP